MRAKRSCPARLPSIACSGRSMRGNSLMSAPPEKLPGFPVTTSAENSPFSSSGSSSARDSSATRPRTFGRRSPPPSSIVTTAIEPRRSRLNWVTGSATAWSLGFSAVTSWSGHVEREIERYRDGEARLPDAEDSDARQRQLTRMGNAAGGAGLALLMDARVVVASEWLHRAADRYRESMADAPPGSWGRPIGAMKALVLAGDRPGAEDAARWALELGAAEAESPIGRYAASLALLILGRDDEVQSPQARDDFPAEVADALAALAAGDEPRYVTAI